MASCVAAILHGHYWSAGPRLSPVAYRKQSGDRCCGAFKANQDLPNADRVNERSAELGTKFNGSPREERVNCRFTLPADSLEGGLRFLASALRGPLFLEDTPGKYWMARMAA